MVGRRGNASVITLPFCPRVPSHALPTLGPIPVAPRTKNHQQQSRFRFYHLRAQAPQISLWPELCLSAGRQTRHARAMHNNAEVTPLKSARAPPRAAPGRQCKLISPVRPRRRCVPRFPSVWWSASGSHSANKRLEGVRLWGALNALSNAKCTIHRET